jgi:hypothetical protein
MVVRLSGNVRTCRNCGCAGRVGFLQGERCTGDQNGLDNVDFADQLGVAVRWNVLGSEEHGEERYRVVRRGLSTMRRASFDNSRLELSATACRLAAKSSSCSLTDGRQFGILQTAPGWRKDRMPFDQLKRREFISLLSVAACRARAAAGDTCDRISQQQVARRVRLSCRCFSSGFRREVL